LLPARQQPVYFVTIPVLRNNRFKTVFLQMDSLLSRHSLGYGSINYHIHKFFNNLKSSLWKCYWVFGVFMVSSGNDVCNAKAFFEIIVFFPCIAIF